MEAVSENMRLVHTLWVLVSILLLSATGCKPDEELECNSLPSEVSIFVGEWEWNYSVMKSNLPAPSPNPYDKVDTITQQSSNSNASIVIRQNGNVQIRIGEEEACYCIDNIYFEHQESDLPPRCRDLMFYDYIFAGQAVGSGVVIECGRPNELWGAGYPHGTGLPPPSPIPTPELLPGFEIKELVSYYSRVQ